MKTIIFGCEENHISIRIMDMESGNVKNKKATTAEQICKILNSEPEKIVMFSSSMDFPEEYTSSKKMLNLIGRLQGIGRQ